MFIPHALRAFRRTPIVSAGIIVSLALGVGVNIAVFSLYEQVIRRELPVPRPSELFSLGAPGPKPGSLSCHQAGPCELVFSYPMFRDLTGALPADLRGLAAFDALQASAQVGALPRTANITLTSGSYFTVLGLQPTVGRLLAERDDASIGANFVAVISHRYWERELAADPNVLTRSILLDGKSYAIVGVAPATFAGTTPEFPTDVFVPLSMRAEFSGWFGGFEDRRHYWLYLFGRVRTGASRAMVLSNLDRRYAETLRGIELPLQTDMDVAEQRQFVGKRLIATDGRFGQSALRQTSRAPLRLLVTIAAAVLLIGCVNVGTLLLTRGTEREGELVVRMALGASRRRLVLELMRESISFALVAGLLSLVVAKATMLAFVGFVPAPIAPIYQARLNWVLFGLGLAASLLAGVLFSLFPAFRSTQHDLASGIRAAARHLGTRADRVLRGALVGTQVALATTLLATTGLFVRSLTNAQLTDAGVSTDRLLTFGVAPSSIGIDGARARILLDGLRTRLQAVPGVRNVSMSRLPVLAGRNWRNNVRIAGSGEIESPSVNFNAIGVDFFQTLGVPVTSGREFTDADVEGSAKVAVVNQAFVERFHLGRGAVGTFFSNTGGTPDIAIVGVVANARLSGIKSEAPAMFFLPYRQAPTIPNVNVYMNVDASSLTAVARSIPALVAAEQPQLAVEGLSSLEHVVAETLGDDRLIALLGATFTILALALAAFGLYAVLSYVVARRTKEIGVRMSVGATSGNIRTLIARQVFSLIGAGALCGVLAAIAIGRVARSMLYEVQSYDIVALAGSLLVLSIVAAIAAAGPTRHAVRIDPLQALRSE